MDRRIGMEDIPKAVREGNKEIFVATQPKNAGFVRPQPENILWQLLEPKMKL
jgi:hypothetical protein